MEFAIICGYVPVRKDNKTEFQEGAKYIVKVAGNNPTINEILNKAKESIPAECALKNYKDYLYFKLLESKQTLDSTKTVKDYGLKEGDILLLQSGIR